VWKLRVCFLVVLLLALMAVSYWGYSRQDNISESCSYKALDCTTGSSLLNDKSIMGGGEVPSSLFYRGLNGSSHSDTIGANTSDEELSVLMCMPGYKHANRLTAEDKARCKQYSKHSKAKVH
jgi:hypothetical protein